jgi:hypothetical protein
MNPCFYTKRAVENCKILYCPYFIEASVTRVFFVNDFVYRLSLILFLALSKRSLSYVEGYKNPAFGSNRKRDTPHKSWDKTVQRRLVRRST